MFFQVLYPPPEGQQWRSRVNGSNNAVKYSGVGTILYICNKTLERILASFTRQNILLWYLIYHADVSDVMKFSV